MRPSIRFGAVATALLTADAAEYFGLPQVRTVVLGEQIDI